MVSLNYTIKKSESFSKKYFLLKMKITILSFCVIAFYLNVVFSTEVEFTFSTAGSHVLTVPAGFCKMERNKLAGGGGAGGGAAYKQVLPPWCAVFGASGGGGAGGFTEVSEEDVSVSENDEIFIIVGVAGAAGSAGTSSSSATSGGNGGYFKCYFSIIQC